MKKYKTQIPEDAQFSIEKRNKYLNEEISYYQFFGVCGLILILLSIIMKEAFLQIGILLLNLSIMSLISAQKNRIMMELQDMRKEQQHKR